MLPMAQSGPPRSTARLKPQLGHVRMRVGALTLLLVLGETAIMRGNMEHFDQQWGERCV